MVLNYRIIYDAYKRQARGKRGAPNQEVYLYYLEEYLFDLLLRLMMDEFMPSPLRLKRLYVPKPRIAQVPTKEDKIVQHLICDGPTYFNLTRSLTPEATANTRGRGTDYARVLLKKQLRSFWAKYRCRPWILKADIHAFFASIPVENVKELIERYEDDPQVRSIMFRFLNLLDRGLPLGLQQSQLLANLYLSELDHLVKERWHFHYYARHMDDFYILSENQESLVAFMRWLEDYLESIGLELNPKTGIFYGEFDYLGFHVLMTETGKIVFRMDKSKRRKKNRHLNLMVTQLGSGILTPEMFETKYFGWRQHALKGNTRNMVLATDRRLNTRLRDIGYRLDIVPFPKGKVRWRVKVTPIKGGIQCREKSHN